MDVRVLSFSFLLIFAAAGLCLETKLISPAELRKRVPMKSLSDFTRFPLSVRTADFVLASNEAGPLFSLQGRDKRGRRWQVILRDAARGAWRSDLGKSRTYYFAGYTGAAGSGPATWILALSFDEQGQPVPFFVTSHGSYDSEGVQDVLDLDGTGPELLEQSYWGNIRDDPGYYVTVLYQQRGPYWYRSDGRHGVHTFPAFEKWSVMWKGRPAELVANPLSERPVRDSSNDPATGIHTTITSTAENIVRVDPKVGCGELSVDVLVTDSQEGRKIDLQSDTQSLANLSKAHAPVTLTGLYHWLPGTGCDASVVWALTDR